MRHLFTKSGLCSARSLALLLSLPFLLGTVFFQDGFENAPLELPPDPETIAPPNPESGATDLFASTEFLYTGPGPIQTGVAPDTIEPARVAIIRGLVTDRGGSALPGVMVSIHGRPELGQTLSRMDGRYDMAVNGGGAMTIGFALDGFLTAQRRIEVPWRDWVTAPDVALVPLDPVVTTIDLTSMDPFQVAQGSMQNDVDGTRQATLLVPQGTTAELVMPDGMTMPITQLDVRATEYTVGPNGPEAMPAELPSTSGYTFAVELSADEAFAAGATDVQFSQPLWFYVENFIGFPTGGDVPSGYYDRQTAQWIPSDDGRIIEILSVGGGEASLDVDGDGIADMGAALDDLGITTAELQQLAILYTAGTSLWRVPIEHFTPWDHNWPYGAPDDAEGPPDEPPDFPNFPNGDDEVDDRDDPCEKAGSIIECQSQTLRESITIAGTPFSLNYRSDRIRPGQIELQVVASGSMVPASLQEIDVTLEVAGRQISNTLPPNPDQTTILNWDGTDAYGREVQGAVPATLTVIYWYNPVYYTPGEFEQSFGRLPSGTDAIGGRNVGRVGISRSHFFGNLRKPLGILDARTQGLGGWTLGPQHAYDAVKQTLFFGDGTKREGTPGLGSYVVDFIEAELFVSGNPFGYPFNDIRVRTLDIAADGSIYVGGEHATQNDSPRLFRVQPDGITERYALFAGGADVSDLALHPDGAVYYVDPFFGVSDTPTILRLLDPDPSDPDDEQTSILITGLVDVDDLEVDSEGGIYFSSSQTDQVFYIPPHKVGPDEITMSDVLAVAGTGIAGFSGDGGLAINAQINNPVGLGLGPDGSLYIADLLNARIRRVDTDGIITTMAGNGTLGNGGDGLPALQAELRPLWLTLDPDGGLFIATSFALRYVRPDGIIVTLAGKQLDEDIIDVSDGFPLSRIAFEGDSQNKRVAIGPDRQPYMTLQGGFVGRQGRLLRLASVLPGFLPGGNLIASEDGTQLYAFDIQGRHLQTVDTFTGEVLFDFAYDPNGWLSSVTDVDGDVTTIQRDVDGTATGILGPEGLLTQLVLNEDLLLESLTNPENESWAMGYDPTSNKLISLANPLNQTSTFAYNNAGRVMQDSDASGGFSLLSRSSDDDSSTVTLETALGQMSTYSATFLGDDTVVLQNTTAAGAVTEIELAPNAAEIIHRPDGVVITNLRDPDPRFGAAAAMLSSTLETPGGKDISYSKSRAVTLVDGEPLNVDSLVETTTYGTRSYIRTFDKAARTVTVETPSGLQQTMTYDAQWRLMQVQNPGLAPLIYSYNAEGDVTEISQDSQFLEFEYDAQDRINLIRDPAMRTMTYSYDNADRLVQMVLPGSNTFNISYDDAGNATTVQMPNGANHVMDYSPIDLLESYTNPTLDTYSWAYDLDRRRTQLQLPSTRTVDYTYDAGGRIDMVLYAEATVDNDYPDPTLRLGSMVWTPSGGGTPQSVVFGYDGHLFESIEFTGVANGAFTYTYDSDLKLTGIQLDVEPVISSSFNDDGLLVAHGPFTISRDPVSSLPSTVSDGTMTISYTFDALGRVLSRIHELNATAIYELQIDYDTSGRLQGRTESVMSSSHDFVYSYDANEQLTGVEIDTVATESYGYDSNGNRTMANGIAATYDTADRLTAVGATSYTFDADGFLSARGTDTFTYSSRGEILSATVGGVQVDYSYDGMARLVARSEGGGTTEYLYGNPASPLLVTHSRAPDSTLTTYHYNEAGLLTALERGGSLYYVAVDQVGSPRVVFDGMGIVKEVIYDAYGVVLTDSNPVFDLAIGFAGGIADPVTGLVRFGLRDYAPETGRWTSRDPILFQGGPNLYMYASNTPVLKRDPTGLFCTGAEAFAGVGAGIEVCYKDGEWSYCTQVGVGVGGGLKLTPFGDVADSADHTFVKAEAIGGLGPVSLGVELKSNDCGTSFKPKCGFFLAKCTGTKIQASAKTDDLLKDKKVSDAWKALKSKDGKWKAGLSAKATAGMCLSSKML